MDRIVQVILLLVLFQSASVFVNTWGLSATAVLPDSSGSNNNNPLNSTSIAGAAGCTYNISSGNWNCNSVSGIGSLPLIGTIASAVYTFGDWLGALQSFVSTFGAAIFIPGGILLKYGVPLGLVSAIDSGIYFIYFLFVILYLRGSRT